MIVRTDIIIIALFHPAEEPKASPAKPPQADETSQDKPEENQEQPPSDATGAETSGQEGEEPPEDESQMVVEDAVEEKQEEGKEGEGGEGEGEAVKQEEKPGIVTLHIIAIRKLCGLVIFLSRQHRFKVQNWHEGLYPS